MCSRANAILVIGSIAVCGFGWLNREWLGSIAGGSHAAEACAVFVFIVTSRVILLLVLNAAVSRQSVGGSFRFSSMAMIPTQAPETGLSSVRLISKPNLTDYRLNANPSPLEYNCRYRLFR
jgi:hypothetical protein